MHATAPAIITSLIPFNPRRFDMVMSYLVQGIYDRPLTLFEMIKHHVMADVFHVLDHGHQIIGGDLQPWKWGPVVKPAYSRLKKWEHGLEKKEKSQPAEYEITPGEYTAFMPRIAFEPDDIAPSEEQAINNAANLLKPMSFDTAYHFFHDNSTFMGRAYNAAKAQDDRSLAWTEIIAAYDAIHRTDHSQIMRRLISYG